MRGRHCSLEAKAAATRAAALVVIFRISQRVSRLWMLRATTCAFGFTPTFSSKQLSRVSCRPTRKRSVISAQLSARQPGPSKDNRSSRLLSTGQVWLGKATQFLRQAFQVLPKLRVPSSASLSTSAALIFAVTIVLGVYTFGVDQSFATFLLRFEQFRSSAA